MRRPYLKTAHSLILVFTAAGWFASARAQIAPVSAQPADEVVLPQFTVEADKDVGYEAADTLSAGRLKTNMLKTPSDVSSLTSEFLSDLGTMNTADAFRYLTSAYPTDPNTDPRDMGGNLTFRGLPAGANTRNFFPYIITVSDYLIDRIEGWRGPNSILYGVGPAGGSANILTKQPRFINAGSLDLRVDSAGSYRTAADIDGVLGKQLAVRLNVIDQDRRNWQKAFKDDLAAVDLAVAYKPWPDAKLTVEGEAGHREQAMSYVPLTDSASSWDRSTTVSGALAAAPAASTGLSRLSSAYLTAANDFSGVMSFLNYAQTSGTNLSLANPGGLPNFPVLPQKQFWDQPADAILKSNYYTIQASYDQTFANGLALELAFSSEKVVRIGPTYNWTSTYIDVATVLPNGQSNPHFGQYYSQTTLNNFYRTANFEATGRAAIAYPINFGGNTQTFSAIVQRDVQSFDPIITMLARDNNPADANLRDAVNSYVYRQYWDNSSSELNIPTDSNGYHFSSVKTRDTHQPSQMNSAQINTVGSYFAQSFTLVGGLRYDDYLANIHDIATYTAQGYPATYSEQIFGAKVTTGSVGFTYFPITPVGVYADYSQGFRPLNRNVPSLPGQPAANATSSTVKTAGLRFNLLGGRIVGSVGYYQTAETGQTQQLSISGVNQIWTDLNLPNQQINPTAYLDTYDYKGHGVEADFTANFTKNWHGLLNFALPKTSVSNAYPGSNAYIAANLATWQKGANDPTNPNAAQIASDIATYLNTIQSQVDGRPLNGAVDWTTNVFTTYAFDRGPLKGWEFGGGANIYGPRIIGNQYNQPFAFVDASSYAIATATIAYHFQLFHFPTVLQANVSNLLDYGKPVYTSVAIYKNVAYKNSYYYVPPPEVLVSLKAQF